MNKTRILIADNQSIVRIGLRTLLHETNRFVVVGEAEDSETALQLIAKHSPDIVILDSCLPHLDATDLIRSTRNTHPDVKILIYTNDETEESFFKAFHEGVHGYLLKSGDAKSVIDAMNALMEGRLFFGPRISELMLKHFLAQPEKPSANQKQLPEHLTKREVEILTLIALGMTNQEIADKLFISFSTVHAHRTNLMAKLNAHGTAQLVRFAIENGLVTPKSEQPAS